VTAATEQRWAAVERLVQGITPIPRSPVPDLEALLAEGRTHDAAMTAPPWHAPAEGRLEDAVLSFGCDAQLLARANSNFPYRANLDGIAWLGTHRRQLLDLAAEALRSRRELVNLRTKSRQLAALELGAETHDGSQPSPCHDWADSIVQAAAFAHVRVSPGCRGYTTWSSGRAGCGHCGWGMSARLGDVGAPSSARFAQAAIARVGQTIALAVGEVVQALFEAVLPC
jgi:hypothetical protein